MNFDPRKVEPTRIYALIPPARQEYTPETEEERRRQVAMVKEYSGKGLLLSRGKEYATAIEPFKAALVAQPNDPSLNYNIGLCYERLGRSPEAVDALLRCVRGMGHRPGVWSLLGGALLSIGRFPEAEEACCMALRLQAKNRKTVLERLGRALWHQGRTAEACDVFRGVLAETDGTVIGHYHLGLDAFRKSDLVRAEHHLRRTVELAPERVDARHLLGVTLCRLGRVAQALEAFEIILKTNPGHPASRWREFVTFVDATVKSRTADSPPVETPGSASAYSQLARTLMTEKRYSSARQVLAVGVQDHPANADIADEYAAMCALCLDYESAIKAWAEILRKSPGREATAARLFCAYVMTCNRTAAQALLSNTPLPCLQDLRPLLDRIPLPPAKQEPGKPSAADTLL